MNDETLAVDVIRKVGPGGHYLAEKHTLKHFKDVLFFPELTDRKETATTLGRRLEEKAWLNELGKRQKKF